MTKLIAIILLTCATAFAQSVIVKATDAGAVHRAGTGAGSVRGVTVPLLFFYVSLDGSHTTPFDTWAKAATNIQAAVNIATKGNTVIVSNGTYYENLVITNSITVQSQSNNPAVTIINGNYPVVSNRCVTMNVDSWLIGFMVTNGYLQESADYSYGGGIRGGSVSNCIITGNRIRTIDGTTQYSWGGGVAQADVYNSWIIGNTAFGNLYADGGGAYGCTLRNCKVQENSAEEGSADYGGICYCTSYNCLIVSNSAKGVGGGGGAGVIFWNCTVISNSANDGGGGIWLADVFNSISWGNNSEDVIEYPWTNSCSCGVGYTNTGSITNDPLFVGSGDYNLQSNSPCIDTGTNQAWMTGAKDLNDNQRIWNTTVDMGAYEYGSEP